MLRPPPFATINLPQKEYSFTPRGGPNLGKTAGVISVVLCYASPLFVQRAHPPAERKGAHGPIGGRGYHDTHAHTLTHTGTQKHTHDSVFSVSYTNVLDELIN